jgi:hypothetical protein
MEKIKILTTEEMERRIAAGETFEQLHLYNPVNVLRPRGTMKKESVGDYLLSRLTSSFEEWTNPKYADNPPVDILMKLLFSNLRDECTNALEQFFEKGDVKQALSEIVINKTKGDL